MKDKYKNRLEVGLKFFKQAEYQRALKEFNKLALNNKDFLFHWYLAHTFFKLFDYSSAIKSVKKSIVLKEKDSLNLSFLAELYLAINKYDFAISTLEEILIIEAKNTNALISLAKIYTEKGDFVKAEEYYFLALECEPDNYGIYYELIKLNNDNLTENLIDKINLDNKKNKINHKNKIFSNLILAISEKFKKNFKLEIKLLIDSHTNYLETKKIAANQEWNYFSNLLPQFIKKTNAIDIKINDQIRPIFVMGLPRSGTTLVENIITSGIKKLPTGGEVEAISKIFFSQNIIKNYDSKVLDTNFNFYKEDFELLKKK